MWADVHTLEDGFVLPGSKDTAPNQMPKVYFTRYAISKLEPKPITGQCFHSDQL